MILQFSENRKKKNLQQYTIRIEVRKLGCVGLRRVRLRGFGQGIIVLRSDAIVKMVAEEAGWYKCIFRIVGHEKGFGNNATMPRASLLFHERIKGGKNMLEIANERE